MKKEEKQSENTSETRKPVFAVVAAIGALVIGVRCARKFTRMYRLNRIMNGNLKLFNQSKWGRIEVLVKQGRKYVLQGWPKPGYKDAQKRQLVAMATGETGESSINVEEMEKLRLDLLMPPKAEEKPHRLTEHGDDRMDPFYWLRSDDRSSPDVIKYLNEENKYTKEVMGETEKLQKELYEEMRGRIQETDTSAPVFSHGYAYYTRTEEGKQYGIHCRKKILSDESELGPEEILLDENEEAIGHEFYMVGGFDVSQDGTMVAYGVDTTGNEMFTLYVKDIKTGKMMLKTPIPDTDGSYAWSADSTSLFYVTKDPLDRPHKVWKHVIGSDKKEDSLVYHEKDDAFYLGMGLSGSEKYIYIHSCRFYLSGFNAFYFQLIIIVSHQYCAIFCSFCDY